MAQRYYATGKRKTSVARVWMEEGNGQIIVNNRPAEEYFGTESSKTTILQPFEITGTVGKFDVMINVQGGGLSGQAGAIRHGITKALMAYDATLRTPLKKAGFVRRDPRVKERKKYGQRGARARFQFSKR
ncbi:MAG: 30S ribosomal protein S9 [Deltaproteobacteria bacterium]|nr:30S ribosomal protein S9 [Deltaproteobacteria bacterium]